METVTVAAGQELVQVVAGFNRTYTEGQTVSINVRDAKQFRKSGIIN